MEALPRPRLTTEALAAQIGQKSQSIRARLCRTGSYFGLHPEVLPNGRLLWPGDGAERLLQARRNAAAEVAR